jgi:hypothetical protein
VIVGKTDAHIRPMDYFFPNDLVDFSLRSYYINFNQFLICIKSCFFLNCLATCSYSFRIGQAIEEKRKKTNYSVDLKKLFDFFAPSLSFFISFLFSNLLLLTFAFLFWLFLKKYIYKGNLSPMLCREQIAFKILSFFYIVFLFLIELLILCNNNTQQIVVDVTDLIYSRETLMATKREACFLGIEVITMNFLDNFFNNI